MCVPTLTGQGIGTVAGLAQNLVGNVISAKSESKNLKYQTQIAINNAAEARNEAMRQQQLGIEAARKEKLEGIKEANLQTAKNSASGLDIMSATNMQNYKDTIDLANSNARDIQSQYNQKADSYFDNANSYLKQAENYKNSYNSTLFSNAMNSLGSIGKVAGKWYSDKNKDSKGGWDEHI